MTLPTAEIVDALLTYLGTLEIGEPALPIAMPDVDFDPAVDAPGGRYLRADVFPNRPAWEGLSSGRRDQGLLQVTVVWGRGEGLVKPYAVADAVKAGFPKGKIIAASGGPVIISGEPVAAQPVIEEGSTSIPVTIPWRA